MRPFTGAQPLVLLLPIAASALRLVLAARIAARRDIGSGLLPARSAEPRLRLLSSPTAGHATHGCYSRDARLATIGCTSMEGASVVR